MRSPPTAARRRAHPERFTEGRQLPAGSAYKTCFGSTPVTRLPVSGLTQRRGGDIQLATSGDNNLAIDRPAGCSCRQAQQEGTGSRSSDGFARRSAGRRTSCSLEVAGERWGGGPVRPRRAAPEVPRPGTGSSGWDDHITWRGQRAAPRRPSSVPAPRSTGPNPRCRPDAGAGRERTALRRTGGLIRLSTVRRPRSALRGGHSPLTHGTCDALQGCGWIRSVRSTPTGVTVLEQPLNISGIRSQPGQAPTRQWSICEHPLRPRVT